MALWLELLDLALTRLHPHHELVIEIAKFLVPILCRGPGQTTEVKVFCNIRRKAFYKDTIINVHLNGA